MLSMPFLLAGLYGFSFYRMCRNAARGREKPSREPDAQRVDPLAGSRAD